jgi:hypothetical protein
MKSSVVSKSDRGGCGRYGSSAGESVRWDGCQVSPLFTARKDPGTSMQKEQRQRQ